MEKHSAKIEVRLTEGLDLIASIGSVLQSTKGLPSILRELCELVVEIMSVEVCSIYLMEDDRLKLKATAGLNPEAVDLISIRVGEGITGSCAEAAAPISVEDAPLDKRFKHIPEVGEDELTSQLSVPMMDADSVAGVLNLQTVSRKRFSDDEIKFLTFLASQLTITMKNAQLHEGLLKGFRELSVIQQISQIISSILDLDELLHTVSRTCAEYLFTRGGIVRLLNAKTKKLEIRGCYGVRREEIRNMAMGSDEGIHGRVLRGGQAGIYSNVHDLPEFSNSSGVIQSSMAIAPLQTKGLSIGTLTVFDKISPETGELIPFSERDLRVISTVSSQVAMAIENARLFDRIRNLADEKEMRIHQHSLVLEITNVMRSMLGLEETLYIILTAVTMGQTFGFNRSALFMCDETDSFLFGKMAVGPKDEQEAAEIWKSIKIKGTTVSEILAELGAFNMNANFEIDHRIKNMRIPLDDEGALARTVRTRRSQNLKNYFSGPHSPLETPLKELRFVDFLAVPLIVEDRVIGVMIVDNMITRNPITEDDVQFLKLFTNQASTAIERARIHSRLESANKSLNETRDLLVRNKTLATLGEFSAGVAHELRNPLVSIGGFARRLVKALDPGDKNHKYAKIIATEVENLESILHQILDFVGGAKPHTREVDINGLLDEILALFHEEIKESGIEVVEDFKSSIVKLKVDEVQMRQLFINLVKNAIQAMPEGGTLKLKSELLEGGSEGAGFEVSDTGCGIDSKDMEKIFDPFFTKKQKGTGLGLPICSRIVEMNHNGRIFIESQPGKGTNVLVWLPPESVVLEEGKSEA